jgi:hypothetical protein
MAWAIQALSGSFGCAPQNALPRNKSVQRFAQDDDFMVDLEMHKDRFVPIYMGNPLVGEFRTPTGQQQH